jgi:hypothetical protein
VRFRYTREAARFLWKAFAKGQISLIYLFAKLLFCQTGQAFFETCRFFLAYIQAERAFLQQNASQRVGQNQTENVENQLLIIGSVAVKKVFGVVSRKQPAEGVLVIQRFDIFINILNPRKVINRYKGPDNLR